MLAWLGISRLLTHREYKTHNFVLSINTSMAKISAPLRTFQLFTSACISDLIAISTPPPIFWKLFESEGCDACVLSFLKIFF